MMRRSQRWLLILTFAICGAAGAQAADTATADLVDRSAFRVCADPNNLPFSNQAREGFENKIAELLASELEVPVSYTYYPDTMGFVRNTLNVAQCDVIMGVGSASELLQNTNPYYTSAYALVYRADSGLQLESMADPELGELRIGVIAQTPPVTVLAKRGLLKNMKSYPLMVDTRHYAPARELIEDVASGETDVGVAWGPFAGYWAARQEVPLEVVPLLGAQDGVPTSFRISMGVRHGEHDWKRQLNALIEEHQDEINEIMHEYGVPLLDRQGRVIGGAEPAPAGESREAG